MESSGYKEVRCEKDVENGGHADNSGRMEIELLCSLLENQPNSILEAPPMYPEYRPLKRLKRIRTTSLSTDEKFSSITSGDKTRAKSVGCKTLPLKERRPGLNSLATHSSNLGNSFRRKSKIRKSTVRLTKESFDQGGRVIGRESVGLTSPLTTMVLQDLRRQRGAGDIPLFKANHATTNQIDMIFDLYEVGCLMFKYNKIYCTLLSAKPYLIHQYYLLCSTSCTVAIKTK